MNETSTPINLAEKTCTPCRGGVPPLTAQEAEDYRRQAPEWSLADDATRIERTYRFRNFRDAFGFRRTGRAIWPRKRGTIPISASAGATRPSRCAQRKSRACTRTISSWRRNSTALPAPPRRAGEPHAGTEPAAGPAILPPWTLPLGHGYVAPCAIASTCRGAGRGMPGSTFRGGSSRSRRTGMSARSGWSGFPTSPARRRGRWPRDWGPGGIGGGTRRQRRRGGLARRARRGARRGGDNRHARPKIRSGIRSKAVPRVNCKQLATKGERDNAEHDRRRLADLEFPAACPPFARRVRRHGRGHVDAADQGRPAHPVDGA